MIPYQPARWRTGRAATAGATPGLLSASSFPGANSQTPPTLLPAPSRPATTQPDDADQQAWDQMMRDRATLNRETDDLHDKYDWMSLPAFLPIAAVAGLEGAGAVASRFLLKQALKEGPLSFPNKEWRFYAGNNRYAQAGQRAHADFRAQVAGKDGWNPKPTDGGPNGEVLRPDAATRGDKYYLELKPNTPSGRRAGAVQARRYQQLTGKPSRPVYYNPDKYR